jgi:hypothetical protein
VAEEEEASLVDEEEVVVLAQPDHFALSMLMRHGGMLNRPMPSMVR